MTIEPAQLTAEARSQKLLESQHDLHQRDVHSVHEIMKGIDATKQRIQETLAIIRQQ